MTMKAAQIGIDVGAIVRFIDPIHGSGSWRVDGVRAGRYQTPVLKLSDPAGNPCRVAEAYEYQVTTRELLHCPTSAQTDLKPGEEPLSGCGSTNLSEPAADGYIDCLECGIDFNPKTEYGADWKDRYQIATQPVTGDVIETPTITWACRNDKHGQCGGMGFDRDEDANDPSKWVACVCTCHAPTPKVDTEGFPVLAITASDCDHTCISCQAGDHSECGVGCHTEVLMCFICNEAIGDDDVWEQQDDGSAYHPSCSDVDAEYEFTGRG